MSAGSVCRHLKIVGRVATGPFSLPARGSAKLQHYPLFRLTLEPVVDAYDLLDPYPGSLNLWKPSSRRLRQGSQPGRNHGSDRSGFPSREKADLNGQEAEQFRPTFCVEADLWPRQRCHGQRQEQHA